MRCEPHLLFMAGKAVRVTVERRGKLPRYNGARGTRDGMGNEVVSKYSTFAARSSVEPVEVLRR